MQTRVDPQSELFKANAAAYQGLLDELRERTRCACAGGGEKLRQRHIDRKSVV